MKLKKSGGGRYTAPCCFHEEKKPSLTFDTNKNGFYCGGCGEHGDVINFYALRHGLSNAEAIKQLGKGLGIPKSKGTFKGLESPKRVETKKKHSQN